MSIEKGMRPMVAKGGERLTVTTATTASNITNFGYTQITTTSSGTGYTLDAPVVGVQKIISMNPGLTSSTADVLVYANTTSVNFNDATTATNLNTLTFDAKAESVSLLGLSTSEWMILNNVGTVTLTNTTGP